jgi:putative transposase
VVKPAAGRQMIAHLIGGNFLSERQACQMIGMSRSAFRYQAIDRGDAVLRERLKQLAKQYPRYGYLMLHSLLKAESLVINKKRTYRVYSEERLQVRTKRPKKLIRPRVSMPVPMRTKVRWSMDFVSDQLANGWRFRVLNIVDDFTLS